MTHMKPVLYEAEWKCPDCKNTNKWDWDAVDYNNFFTGDFGNFVCEKCRKIWKAVPNFKTEINFYGINIPGSGIVGKITDMPAIPSVFPPIPLSPTSYSQSPVSKSLAVYGPLKSSDVLEPIKNKYYVEKITYLCKECDKEFENKYEAEKCCKSHYRRDLCFICGNEFIISSFDVKIINSSDVFPVFSHGTEVLVQSHDGTSRFFICNDCKNKIKKRTVRSNISS